MSSFKVLDRFAMALTKDDGEADILRFQKSQIPGHAQIFIKEQWWDFPVAPLLNGIFTMMPDEEQAPAPRNPLRPVR